MFLIKNYFIILCFCAASSAWGMEQKSETPFNKAHGLTPILLFKFKHELPLKKVNSPMLLVNHARLYDVGEAIYIDTRSYDCEIWWIYENGELKLKSIQSVFSTEATSPCKQDIPENFFICELGDASVQIRNDGTVEIQNAPNNMELAIVGGLNNSLLLTVTCHELDDEVQIWVLPPTEWLDPSAIEDTTERDCVSAILNFINIDDRLGHKEFNEYLNGLAPHLKKYIDESISREKRRYLDNLLGPKG